jgi:hypothetical protein
LFKRGIRFGAEGAVLMLDIIKRRQVYGHEARPLQFQQAYGRLGAALIAVSAFIRTVRKGFRVAFQKFEQPRRGEQPQKPVIVSRAGAPILRNVEVDGGSRGNLPLHVGGGQPGVPGFIPQRGNLEVRCVPIPALIVPSLRVESGVGQIPWRPGETPVTSLAWLG